MADVLNLSHSLVRIETAKHQCDELLQVFRAWNEAGGIAIETVRDPVVALYKWNVAVSAVPSRNLSALTGDIVDALWKALDYIAFEIYRVAGGASDGGTARQVAFPIMRTEPDDWNSVVGRKVPGVWPEAADALRAAQPFSQEGEDSGTADTSRTLSHRQASPRDVRGGSVFGGCICAA